MSILDEIRKKAAEEQRQKAGLSTERTVKASNSTKTPVTSSTKKADTPILDEIRRRAAEEQRQKGQTTSLPNNSTSSVKEKNGVSTTPTTTPTYTDTTKNGTTVENSNPLLDKPYSKETADMLTNNVETAYTAFTSRWENDSAFETEISALQKTLDEQETQLESLKRRNATSEFESLYKEYSENLSAYNNLVSEYKSLADAYNTAYKDYSDYYDKYGDYFGTSFETSEFTEEYWNKRYEEEKERILKEAPYAPAAAYAIAIVDEERKQLEEFNKLKDKKYDDNLIGRWLFNNKLGSYEKKADMASSDYQRLDRDAARYRNEMANAERTLQLLTENNPEILDTEGEFGTAITQDLARHLPDLAGQLEYGGKGALVGGTILGVASGGTLAVKGAKAGYMAGSAYYSYQRMRGAAFRELISLGVDEETAIAAAHDEGVVSGLIELADSGLDVMGVGYIKTAIMKGFSPVAKLFMGYLGNSAQEGGEEGLQQIVSIANRERALRGETGILGLTGDSASLAWDILTGKNTEHVQEVTEASKGGITLGLLTGAPATAGGIIANTIYTNSQKHNQKTEQADVGKAQLPDTLEQAAYKTAEAVKAKIDNGETVTDADVGHMVVANQKAIEEERTAERTTEATETAEEALMRLAEETVAERGKTAQTAIAEQEQAPPKKKKGRSEEEKLATYKKSMEQSLYEVSQQSEERQKYLHDRYEEDKEVLEGASVGDVLYTGDDDVVGEVVASNEFGMTILGEDGFIEQIPRGTYSNSTAVETFLATGGYFVAKNADGVEQHETEIDAVTVAEERAIKSAYEAGKLNVPHEKVSLDTPAQEEAYNAGRLEHIRNMGSTVQTATKSAETLETETKEEYTVGENGKYEYSEEIPVSMGSFENKQEGRNNVKLGEASDETNPRGQEQKTGPVGEKVAHRKGSTSDGVAGRINEILRKAYAKNLNKTSDKTSRTEKKESRDAFEERARNDDYMYIEVMGGRAATAFKYADEANWNKNAKTAERELSALGFDVIVFSGELRRNMNGITEESTEGTTMRGVGSVTIFISANLDVDGLETAFHEAFHAAKRGLHTAKYYNALSAAIADGVNVDSEAFENFVFAIADAYSYAVREVSLKRFSEEVREEFYAWYIGKSYATDGGVMRIYMDEFSNVDAVKTNLDTIFSKMEGESNPHERKTITSQKIKPNYGENGMKTFKSLAEENPDMDHSELVARFDAPYQAGLTGVERRRIELLNDFQVDAYEAGRLDYFVAQAKDAQHKPSTILKDNISSNNIADSFGITNINDYVGVQKAVIKTLKEEGFFQKEGEHFFVAVSTADGLTVEITPKGIKETLGSEERFEFLGVNMKKKKLAIIRQLPDLLRKAKVVSDDNSNYHNPKSKAQYTYMKTETQIDGDACTVRLVIRNSPQKNLFWIHYVDIKKQDHPNNPLSDNKIESNGNRTDDLADTTISQESSSVSIQNDQKTISPQMQIATKVLRYVSEGQDFTSDRLFKIADAASGGSIRKEQNSGATGVDNRGKSVSILQTKHNYGEISEESNVPIYETLDTRRKTTASDIEKRKRLLSERQKTMKEATIKYALSNKEASRLDNYVGGSLCYLLNKKCLEGTMLDGDRAILDSIVSALKKFPQFSGRTFRNLEFKTKEKFLSFLQEHSVGNVVTLKALTSTSKIPNGYSLFEDGVVHMVIDGTSGYDIADTFGQKHQQEVTYIPGTKIKITRVTTANDGKPLIYAQEVATNEVVERQNDGNNEYQRPEQSVNRNDDADKQSEAWADGSGESHIRVQEEARSVSRRDDVRSERRESAESGNVSITDDGLNPVDKQNAAALDESTDGETENDVVADSDSDRWRAVRAGSTEKTPKPLSEIVEQIRQEFGLNITVGHIRGKGKRGQYNRKNQGIRTKIANNLPTISHELGHHLSDKYNLLQGLDDDIKAELHDALGDGKKKYKKNRWTREGFAEYVRQFLQNRELATIEYPKVTDYFLKALSGRDLAVLGELADEINAYYSLDNDTMTSSIRLGEEDLPDARSIRQKAKAIINAYNAAMRDVNDSIKRFDRETGANVYKIASNAAYSDAIAAQLISGGDLTDANGQYVGPGLKTALHGLDLNNLDEYRVFGEYLVVKHGPERLAEGMDVTANGIKNNSEWMQNRQVEIEAQYPQFAEISERLYEFITAFYETWGVETGLIGEETFKDWQERWQFYVPFNRAINNGRQQGAKRGFANQTSTIKKARGSGRDIIHPVDNLINNMVKMVNAGVRNNVMAKIAESAEALDISATFLEKVPMPLKTKKMNMTGVKENLSNLIAESDMDAESKATADDIVSNLDDILIQYGRGKAYGDVITVLKDGKPEYWKINDPQLLRSLTSMSPKTMDGLLDAYAVVSRFMTANITGNNLIWSLFSNFPRDMMTFFTYSKDKNVVRLVKGVGDAYLNRAKGDESSDLYKEFLAMGGGRVSAYSADRNLAKKARQELIGKKFDANPLDWITYVSDTIESGPRFATYKLMREAGMNPQEAFYEAMDITVNFRRGGWLAREINKVVPFFNANMQGLDKFARWITADDAPKDMRKKVIKTRVTSYVAASLALAVIVYALNMGSPEREEEYEQLSNYTKNSFWVIPVGDGKFFAIPKPREIAVLSSFFETCLEYFIGENRHAFDEFYSYAAENGLPAIANDIAQVGQNGLVETGMNIIGSLGIIGVVGYLGANRDFLGRPIVSSGLQNLEKKDQYTQRTSKIAYWIGQAFNGSPQQIDYFFEQVLGGWWKSQKALFPVGKENIDGTLGIRNTYIKDNQYSTDITNWLYDRADKTSRAKASDPSNISKAIEAKLDSNMTSFYGSYYKLSKNRKETVATRATRQTVLDMIYEYQKGIEKGATPKAQSAVEGICRSKNSTEYLPSVMPVDVKDGNGVKYTLSDVQYVEYQIDYLRLYWETVEDTLDGATSNTERAQILLAAKKVAKEQATANTLSRIGAPKSEFTSAYSGVSNNNLVEFFAKTDAANDDGSITKNEVVDVLSSMSIDDNDAWTLYLSRYDSKGAKMAQSSGIGGNTYIDFLNTLDDVDQPTEKGEYGSYTQDEATTAIRSMSGLSNTDKAILWQSVNKNWKTTKNPWRKWLP